MQGVRRFVKIAGIPNLIYPETVEFANYPGGHNEGFPDSFKQMFKKVYRYIKDGHSRNLAPQFPTFADGHREVILCESILRSSEKKQWTKVEY